MASIVGRVRTRFFGSAASTAAGVAMGGAIRPTLSPYLQDLANELWSEHPSVPLSPMQAAQAELAGHEGDGAGEGEAKLTGVSPERFAALQLIAANAPQFTELLDLLRRGEITDAQMDTAQRLGMVPAPWRARLRALRNVLPSVTDMVRFAVREVYNPAQRDFLDLDAEFPDAFAADADNIGLSRERAGQYWAAHWELPSYEQGVQMFFRGEISAAQLDSLLKAQDYAPTWRSKLRAIAEAIPGIQDMIRFAVHEVYDPAKRRALDLDAEFPAAFAAQAKLHGMSEAHAREYWAAHWRLPSPEQGFRMLHRAEITLAELDGLLKAQDFAPVWRDRIRNIAYLVPGRIDLRRMLAAGVIDRARVKRGYLDLGYTPADAEILTTFAEQLAASSGGAESHVARARTQLWTRAHSSYLAAEISEDDARAALTEAGVLPAAVDDVLALWNHERELERKQLTPAQVKKAFTKGVENPATGSAWTKDEATAALVARGYSTADATTFLEI